MSDQHTTHFDDCGCLSAQHEAEITEYRDAAITGSMQQQARIDKLEAEVERLREAIQSQRDSLIAWAFHQAQPTGMLSFAALDDFVKALAGKEAEG